MLDTERPEEPPKSQEIRKRTGKSSSEPAWQQVKTALGRLLRPYKQVLELASSALFVACLVHWLTPLVAPLETPSRMVLALAGAHLNGASNPQLDLADRLLVLKIDRSTFRAHASTNNAFEFNGITPLDRCVLRERLKDSLQAMPDLRVLGIDLDLSPTGLVGQDQCGQDILKLLGERKGLKSFLILPVDKEERKTLTKWREQVQDHGLFLANPDLLIEYGIVRRHELVSVHTGSKSERILCPSLGVAMAGPASELKLTREPGVNWRQGLESCFDPTLDVDESTRTLNTEKLSRDEHNIAYQHIGKRLAVPEALESAASFKPLREQLQRPGIEKVRWAILGADFDRSDSFRTPLGELSGVEVHAAIASDPAEGVSHIWGFILDILLGMAFGWFVHHVWRHYFDQRLGLHPSTYVDADKRAYLILLGLLLVWLLLALLILPSLSLMVLLSASLWINPVPMLIGMSIDAFVVGSVKVALELMQHSHPKSHLKSPHPAAHTPHRRRGPLLKFWHDALKWAPLATWVILVLGTAVASWMDH